MSDLIRAEDVKRSYRVGGTNVEVLRGVTLALRHGEIVGLLGPSGAGKSTLLHLLGLLDRPSSGDVYLEGRALGPLPASERARIRNRRIGFVFQMYHLIPDCTALENVLMPHMVRRSWLGWLGGRGQARKRAAEMLDRLGLGHRLRHRPSQLSGGECQRVAIARALSADPDLVLCDEPTGNLDTDTGDQIMRVIEELNRTTRKTFLIVTHDPELAARTHRTVRIVDGLLAHA